MKVAIIQSNYLPWKGYFDIIHDVDLFVFYDDVQYTVRDWRNRNKIKAPNGALWLTVPVAAGSRDQIVADVTIVGTDWAANHWKSIVYQYGSAPYFRRYKTFFEHVYLERHWQRLSELNQFLILHISREMLGIKTSFVDSATLAPDGRKQSRLLDVLHKVNATAYVSGPSAKGYIEPAGFTAAGIELYFKDYAGYPEYPQSTVPFEPAVSILDLLFQMGPDAPYHIWGWREISRVVSRASGSSKANSIASTPGEAL
jgi:hypothetical protein